MEIILNMSTVYVFSRGEGELIAPPVHGLIEVVRVDIAALFPVFQCCDVSYQVL